MRTLFIVLFVTAGIGHSAITQTHNYDVLIKGEKKGTLAVSKKESNGKINYSYHIEIKVNLLAPIYIVYDVRATYDEEKLLHSSVDNKVNGMTQHSTDVNWYKDHYIINTPNTKNLKYTQKIQYSAIRLFFNEPKGLKQVFSERQGKYVLLTTIEGGNTCRKAKTAKKTLIHTKTG